MSYLLNRKVLGVLAGALGSIAAMGAGLNTWHDALSPAFIFGAIGALATAITALHLDKPEHDN